MAGKVGNPGLRGRLLEKSVEAYVHALETINRLSIKYRVEAFTYLACNAWELLLKAKLIADTGNAKSIYYPCKRGKKRRTLSLRDCLKKVIANDNDPIRLNVERVADLRDEACHLVISTVPKEVLGLFQSCVLNYHKKLNEWFSISLSDRVSVGMMTIVYDFKPEEYDISSAKLRKQMGKETADYLLKYQAKLKEEYSRLDKVAEYSIDINYHLAIVKKLQDGDISLTTALDGVPAHIIEVPKDAGKTHPLRQKEVLSEVIQKIAPAKISAYDLHCVRRVHDIEKRPDFYYKSPVRGSPTQYSHAYVDWLVQEFNRDSDFFNKARVEFKRCPKNSAT
jgi:hypothetical protein